MYITIPVLDWNNFIPPNNCPCIIEKSTHTQLMPYATAQLDYGDTTTFTPTSGASVTEVLEPFIRGLNRNRSIHTLNFRSMDQLGGKIFNMLVPFFENSSILFELRIKECNNLGDDGWRSLALAIGSNKNKSLRKVSLIDNNISDEGMVDIITALSMHPHLENLGLMGNHLSNKGCTTLSTFLKCSATQLQTLNLENNEINDQGIDYLVPAVNDSGFIVRYPA